MDRFKITFLINDAGTIKRTFYVRAEDEAAAKRFAHAALNLLEGYTLDDTTLEEAIVHALTGSGD